MSARRLEVEIGTLVVDDPRLAHADLARAVGEELERLLGGDATRATPSGHRRIATVRTQIASRRDLDAAGVGRAVATATFEVLGR